MTRQRLYLETMNEVLSKVDKVIVSGSLGGKTLPVLPLEAGAAARGTMRPGGTTRSQGGSQ